MEEVNSVVLTGIVKSVLSGDTVIVRGNPAGCSPPERIFTIAHVLAPKVAKRPQNKDDAGTKDEPFAWHSRENLRTLVIGREIQFKVSYTIGDNHDFGQIFVQGIDVGQKLVSLGLLKVKQSNNMEPEHKKLAALEDAAKTMKVGIFSENKNTMRNVTWAISEKDMSKFIGKEYDATVENVRDGGTIRVFLLPSFVYVTITLAGIKTPQIKQNGNVEPYADEAKYFTEVRLLNRGVKVKIQGINNQGFFGTVLHPAGNISECLLNEGFASIVNWNLGILPVNIQSSYKSAEMYAKRLRLRIFSNYTPSDESPEQADIAGKVVEIVNGESVNIKLADNTLKRIHLASVRQVKADEIFAKSFHDLQKKMGNDVDNDSGKPNRNLNTFTTPWLYEAKEFLRKKLVGKKVRCSIDYTKTAEKNYPEKTCCTVYLDEEDVGESLVSKGLARVIYHKGDDDNRSSRYSQLRLADDKAAEAKKGCHKDSTEAPLHRISDINNLKLAKQFLPIINKKERIQVVVDYVLHSSKFRLFLPKDDMILNFLLAGVSCPRGGNRDDAEPFAAESLEFSKDLCLQREVEVMIDGIDKVGNFTGTMWVNGKSVGLELVKIGYAKVHPSAKRLMDKNDYFTAEEVCKQARKNIWENFVEEVVVEETKEEEEAVSTESSSKGTHVKVCDVVSPTHLWVQNVEGHDKQLEVLAEMNTHYEANAQNSSFKPKAKEMCATKFVDGKWYRARVERVDGDSAIVFYVDYGNHQEKTLNELYPLTGTYENAFQPMAYQVFLAGIDQPEDEDWYELATDFVTENSIDKDFSLNIVQKIDGVDAHESKVKKIMATLTDKSTNVDLASSLISEGLATVKAANRDNFRIKSLLDSYEELQKKALNARKAMWEYGDFRPTHAPEFGAPPPAGDRK